mmetsp:Transcript_106583/g.296680  ORF Transcript_106583/g.296680 Transcript_106583/m.296680 type:complete len:124 (-) Transcript_106583:452-823(-)
MSAASSSLPAERPKTLPCRLRNSPSNAANFAATALFVDKPMGSGAMAVEVALSRPGERQGEEGNGESQGSLGSPVLKDPKEELLSNSFNGFPIESHLIWSASSLCRVFSNANLESQRAIRRLK